MHWLSIWWFARQPVQLFQGWLFILVALMLLTSIAVACSMTTAQLLRYLWSFPECQHQNQQLALPTTTAGKSSSTQRSSSSSPWHSKLVMVPTLLLVILASLLLHGGAVIADIRIILVWRRWRAARHLPSKMVLAGDLARARHYSREVYALLSLLFSLPAVLANWSLVILLADYDAIPILSSALNALSCIISLTVMFGRPFWAHCPAYVISSSSSSSRSRSFGLSRRRSFKSSRLFRQLSSSSRSSSPTTVTLPTATATTTAAPAAAAAAAPSRSSSSIQFSSWQRIFATLYLCSYLLGTLLWRFSTASWIVMKFGGSGTNYFVYSAIATALLANLSTMRQAERRAFMECYRNEKAPVLLCTVL